MPSVLIVRLCYGGWESPALGSWLASQAAWAAWHSDVSLADMWLDVCPIDCAHNLAACEALRRQADYLCLVDADVWPDHEPGAKPFLPTALAFAKGRLSRPCVIGAPVVNRLPGGQLRVCAFCADDLAGPPLHMRAYTPGEAIASHGVQLARHVGPGLALIDTRVFRRVKPPWFFFTYADETNSEVLVSEEINFGLACQANEVPHYVAWDSWAAHGKGAWLLTRDLLKREVTL